MLLPIGIEIRHATTTQLQGQSSAFEYTKSVTATRIYKASYGAEMV